MNNNKYINKLNIINSQIESLSPNTTGNELIYSSYLNYFNVLNDLIDEIINDITMCGVKVNLLFDIINNPIVISSLKFISKHNKSKVFSDINPKSANIKAFTGMLDAYILSERDSSCLEKIISMMKNNIFLSKITNKEFIINYTDVIKNIYSGALETGLTNICEIFASSIAPSTEMSSILANLLTYLSATLELPDVYVYSKKMILDLSMINHDYKTAYEVIRDLDDMHYNNTDLKYYRALIKQKNKNPTQH